MTLAEYVKNHYLRRYYSGQELVDEIMRAVCFTGGDTTTAFMLEYKDNLRADIERIINELEDNIHVNPDDWRF